MDRKVRISLHKSRICEPWIERYVLVYTSRESVNHGYKGTY